MRILLPWKVFYFAPHHPTGNSSLASHFYSKRLAFRTPFPEGVLMTFHRGVWILSETTEHIMETCLGGDIFITVQDGMLWAYICSRGFFVGLFLVKLIFKGAIIGGIFTFQNGLGLTIKRV